MKNEKLLIIFFILSLPFQILRAARADGLDATNQTRKVAVETPDYKSKPEILIRQKLAAMKPKDFMDMYKSAKMRGKNIKNMFPSYIKSISKPNDSPKQTTAAMPDKFRVPAEYDEAQAVYIAWPYNAFDSAGNFVEPFIKGYALDYEEVSPGNYRPKLITVQVFEPDVENDSPYPAIWMKLANIIQQEVPVWIQIHRPQDSSIIKQYMASRNTPLTNYRFMLKEDWGNAFWMRDCGPYGFYYGDDDSLAFLDASYYPGRPLDDDIPSFLANRLGYQNVATALEIEGGNFMTDGHGTGFYSDALFENNNDNLGRAFTPKNPATPAQIRDTIKRVFGLTTPIELKALQCDGGTGHIDIYTKMLNDRTIAISEYPKVMQTPAFSDYATVQSNLSQKISAAIAYDGKVFDILRLPLPTNDNGQYNKIVCDSFGLDARGYINGLLVNSTYIFPSFSDEQSGNAALDAEARAIYERALPGYRVEPLDSRWLTPLGGAVHCITMQIPAENPVKFNHKPLSGIIPKPGNGGFDIAATIANHSGIAVSSLKWRKKGDSEFEEISASAPDYGNLAITIPASNLQDGDEIEYYLAATTKNGRSVVYPFSAPKRLFTFKIGAPSSAEDNFDRSASFSILPNPVNNNALCWFSLKTAANIEMRLTDALGRNAFARYYGIAEAGVHSFQLSTTELQQGVYFAVLYANGSAISSVRVIVQ